MTARESFLVTGATGFLGRHVIDAIRIADPEARILGLVRDPAAESLERLSYLEGVELITGSPVDIASWHDDPRLEGIAGIYHLAAEVKHSRHGTASMMRINIAGPIEMVRLAAEKKCRLVFSSTSGTVGCSANADDSPDESAPYCEAIVKDWPYYVSKITAEKEATKLAAELGVELVIIRPPVMLGPGDHRFRSVSNVMRVLDGRLPFIFTGGINFTDIRDAAAAMVRAMRHPSPHPVYNLPGTSSSLDAFFRRIAAVAGIEPSWRVFHPRLVWLVTRLNELVGKPLSILPDPVVIEMASQHWGLSSRYAALDLGYSIRDPDVTISETVEWIRQARARQVSDAG